MNKLTHCLFGLLWVVSIFAACHDRGKQTVVIPPVKAEEKAGIDAQPTTLADAIQMLKTSSARISYLKSESDQESLNNKNLKTTVDRLTEEDSVKKIRSQATFVSWLAGFGFFASVAAFFLFASSGLPWVRTLTVSGAGAALAVLAVARVVSWMAPYLLLIGGCLTGLGVLGLAFYLWKSSRINKDVVGLYEKVKPALDGILGRSKRLEMQAEAVGAHTGWIQTIQKRMGINQ